MDTDLIQAVSRLGESRRWVRGLLQLGWLHEGVHYLAARAVRVPVLRTAPTGIEIAEDEPRKVVFIALAPAMLGLVAICGLAAASPWTQTRFQEGVFALLTILVLVWLAVCQFDIQDVWEMVSIENAAAWQEAAFRLFPFAAALILSLGMAGLYLLSSNEAQRILFQALAFLGIGWMLVFRGGLQEAWKVLRRDRA